ncbi:glycosyltransferase family 4 protein [Herpetosiphon sp. NSE202]|uniref:glycosyltransferase family 4 protein n=1 Tax=Herpetosiphon sp. NSE202 TaxID=3351349 RepID=UPI00363C0CFC
MKQATIALDLRVLDDHFPGIGRFTYDLTLALLQTPIAKQLHLVLPHQPQTQFDLTPILRHAAISRVQHGLFGLGQHGEWRSLLREINAELAIFPYYIRPLFQPCPSITFIYDTISWRVPASFSRSKRWQIAALHHVAIQQSAAIGTISHSAASDIAQFYSVNPQRLAYLGVGISEQFQPQPAATIAALRAKYGLPERYIVYVASDKPHKQIDFLLQAWQAAQTGEVGLVLGGRWSNPASEQLLANPSLHGRVWRIADVPEADLATLYSGALALAFPSLYEGFGLPALEAIACGTPVLAQNSSSLPEAVGTAGCLLPNEQAAWVAALERICHDGAWRRDLAAQANAQAAKFSWAQVAQRLVKLLDAL